MLEKFEIDLKYHRNGSKKIIELKEMENDDLTISVANSSADRLVLDLTPKGDTGIQVDSFNVVYYYDFLPRFRQFQRIFVNGYQSSSSSREYFTDQSVPVCKAKAPGGNIGDYSFATYKKGCGNFHSSSYTYLRNNDEIELFASLNEATGFTTFYIDVLARSFVVNKDVKGVNIESRYEIMNIARYVDEYNAAFDKWFADMKVAKPRVKHAKGYTTWYNYYDKINQKVVLAELESIASLEEKIDIFQIDDGYESAIGDWLTPKKNFGSLEDIAAAIHDKGMKAGLWLAPFAVGAKSKLYKEHKDWLVKDGKKPVLAGKKWGGFYTLDIYNEEVREHLRELFDVILKDWHFDMVKLDDLYQVAIFPYNNKSRGEIMTDAMKLLRELCGDKLILGCNVPLYPAFGKVDFCRIGPEMSPKWKGKSKYREDISTMNAMNNSIFRRHLDGRAFVNDPDVFMLREGVKMNAEQRKIVANVNRIFGNVLFTSDSMTKYKKDWQNELLSEMFSDTKMKVMGAEYVTNGVLHIKYFNGTIPTLVTMDMRKGIMLKQEVDAKDLKVSGIDDILASRGETTYSSDMLGNDYSYDDFELDRELTAEEKAAQEEQKAKLEEERKKKIAEAMAKKAEENAEKKAEFDAKKAEIEAKNAEIEKKMAENEAKRAEYEAKKAEIEKKKAEIAERKAAQEEAKKKAKEEAEAKAKAAAEAKAKAEAEAKAKAEAEAKAKAEEEAKKKAEAEVATKAPAPAPKKEVKAEEPAEKPATPKPADAEEKPAPKKAEAEEKPAAPKKTATKKPAAPKPAPPKPTTPPAPPKK